jgi:AcrR family transcriptional regulator
MEVAKKPRQSQQERSALTRNKLLNSTLQIIDAEGWHRASMQRICEHAGVSRGAQTHHFPTRESLLIASVREIVKRYQSDLTEGPIRLQNLEAFFDFLWDATFNDNLLICWVEAMVAARTDASLKRVVADTDASSMTAMRALGAEASQANGPVRIRGTSQVEDLVELTVCLLRGLVLQQGVHHDLSEKRRLFELWTRIVAEVA